MAKLPSVTNKVLDGGLRITPSGAREPWAAVGAASIVPGAHAVDGQQVSAVRALGTPREVREQLGRGDLPELLSSALAITEGQCFGVSVAGARAPGTRTPRAANAGPGAIALGYAAAVAGANAEYSGSVTITKAGILGAAEFRVAIDGVMDQVRTVPAAGTYAIPDTDMVLTFEDDGTTGPATNSFGDNATADEAAATVLRDTYAAANAAWLAQYDADPVLTISLQWAGGGAANQRRSGGAWEDVVPGFAAGDAWTISTPAPTATSAQVLAAIEELVCSEHRFRWISVAGVSTSSLWAALASKADQLASAANPRYIHFKSQHRRNAAAEDAATWQAALTGTERGNVSSTRLQVWAAWVDETDPWGVTEDRPMIGRANGLSARRRAHETIDAVKRKAIPGVDGIVPAGLTDAQILALDQAGYATVRIYGGLRGVYVTHGRMLAPPGSDFRLEERRRVMDRACELVHDRQRDEYLNSELDLDAGGLAMFLRVSSQPLQLMQDLGEITSFEISLANTVAEILSTDTIRTRIRVQPLGKASQIENEISYYSGAPQTQTEEEA